MKQRIVRACIILAVIAIAISLVVTAGYLYAKTAAQAPDVASGPLLSGNSAQSSKEPAFSIHFFDVGEADSALVACDGHYMLIDGGSPGNSSFLYAYLQRNQIDHLDYIVCSHAHSDHVGGLAGALNYADVDVAYAPVTDYDSRAFQSFVRYLDAQDKAITVPSPGDSFRLGRAEAAILAPIDMSLAEADMNNSSIILRIEFGNTSFLFTGDAETEEEASVLLAGTNVASTVLKVGHHGSYSSTSEAFLAAVAPEYAVISVGADNEYGHPHLGPLSRLQNVCKAVYRTDENGEIVCWSDGETVTFAIEKSPAGN